MGILLDDFIGQYFENNSGEIYYVTEFINNDSKNKYYKILFPYSGYSGIYTKSQIKKGTIKDRYLPTVAGVGYLGNAKSSRSDKIYSLWHNMLLRCYDKKCIEYKRYGELGVRVCLRWHNFENFKNDIINIDGFNMDLLLKNELQLDKDKKQINIPINKRIYSPYTCTFLTIKENNDYSNIHYDFTAISPKGIEYEDNNLSNFCNKHNINVKQAYAVINGWQHTTKGWIFRKKNECND